MRKQSKKGSLQRRMGKDFPQGRLGIWKYWPVIKRIIAKGGPKNQKEATRPIPGEIAGIRPEFTDIRMGGPCLIGDISIEILHAIRQPIRMDLPTIEKYANQQ